MFIFLVSVDLFIQVNFIIDELAAYKRDSWVAVEHNSILYPV